MLRDIRQAYATAGLRLNASKCKVQTNTKLPHGDDTLKVDDLELPIVSSSEGFMALGILRAYSIMFSPQVAIWLASRWPAWKLCPGSGTRPPPPGRRQASHVVQILIFMHMGVCIYTYCSCSTHVCTLYMCI